MSGPRSRNRSVRQALRARAGRHRAPSACRHRARPHAHRVLEQRRSSTRCRRSDRIPNPRFALADRTDEERSMRDRLVARNGDVPDEGGTGSTLTARRAPERRAQRTLRLQKLVARRASRSPATKRVSVPPRSGERCLSSKSSRLIRSAERACVIPASTPGRSGTWTRIRWREPGSGYACSSILRRLRAASPTQRARKPASPAASARSSCSIRRLCSASASDMGWEFSSRMSTQMRGLAPATRVMSRSEPPATDKGRTCRSVTPPLG